MIALLASGILPIFAGQAHAREVTACGAEIHAVDAKTGRRLGVFADERMVMGPTGAHAQNVALAAAGPGPFVRARFKTCDPPAAKTAAREVLLALPELAEARTFAPVHDWKAQEKPLPREMDDTSGKWWVRGSSHVLTAAGGETLQCLNAEGTVERWRLRLLPEGTRVAGTQVDLDVYEQSDRFIVVTDRFGLFAVGKNDGKQLWHYSYSNADEVPSVLIASGTIVAGPIRAATKR